jgi:hypothetical protein
MNMLKNPRIINAVTNIVAVILMLAALIQPIETYLNSAPFSWTTFLLCLGGSISSYFVGKPLDTRLGG